jgi:peroxiredoxin
VKILGLSRDSAESPRNFIAQHKLYNPDQTQTLIREIDAKIP